MYSFPKSLRLRSRYEYKRVSQGACRYVGKFIIVEIRQGKGTCSKLGITVTRRYGKAHDRNRFKRIVREAFRLSHANFPSNYEIHVRPRSEAMHATMFNIQQEMIEFVKEREKFAHLSSEP